MEQKYSVVLADTNAEFRARLKEKIAASEDFAVVGETDNGRDALRLVQELRPALLVFDLILPELDGFGLLAEVRSMGKAAPQCIVASLFCTDRIRPDLREGAGACSAGASGSSAVHWHRGNGRAAIFCPFFAYFPLFSDRIALRGEISPFLRKMRGIFSEIFILLYKDFIYFIHL